MAHPTKMNVENENIEPVTDLQLALGYSNNSIQRRLSNDVGAGANAASRIELTFVTTDPLSELVWSPQKGPSLKCTDSSFLHKKHSLVWGAGPSNVVLSPQQIYTSMRSSNEKPIYEENFNTSMSTLYDMNTKVAEIDNSNKSARDTDGIRLFLEQRTDNDNLLQGAAGFVEEISTKREESDEKLIEKNNQVDSKGVYVSCPNNSQVAELAVAMEDNFPSSPDEIKPDVAHSESLSNDPANQARDGSSGTTKSRMEIVLASEVHTGNQGDTCALREKNPISAGRKPEESASSMEKKGKSKMKSVIYSGLSDGDVKGMMSKEEDDSHESVESRNSVGLFSSDKKRWGFEQQLIVESKRVKKQIGQSPCSSSFVKQDSSFMNWISNMMKGFSKSTDDTPSLALTVANPNQSEESPQKNLDENDTNQDPGCRNIGFHSIFQSIYSPKSKVQGTTQNENSEAGLGLNNKIYDINATPIACHGENFSFRKIFLLSNERFKETTSCGRAGASTQPKISSMNLSPSKRSSEIEYNSENKNSCNLAAGLEKDGASSSSSLGKRKVMTTENTDSDPQSEGKTPNGGYKGNLLGSLWNARFTPKSSSSLLKENTGGAVECSNDCMRLIPCSQNSANFSSNLKIVEASQKCAEAPLISCGKGLANFTADIETSIGFNKIIVQNDQKAKCNVSPILSLSRSKDSEAMASLFARRLDALKHIMPSGVSDSTAASTLCFFCGKKGHHLQYCPEVTDNEIEDLLRNIKSSNRLEELPCVCIRCFELNHWAVACTKTSSRGQHQSSHRASLANLSDGIDTGKGPSTIYGVTADKARSNTNLNEKYVASSSNGNELIDNQIKPWGNFISEKFSAMPKAIFDAVRMLRFSRIDILKWMNSQISLTHLEGFFLRLRLGKWEEGLGGTGYYVACITGAHRQSTQRNSKSYISVNVGGVKCLVESQYISNHDFLEDELLAWWYATTRNGGKIPSEQELTMKVKERRMLGF